MTYVSIYNARARPLEAHTLVDNCGQLITLLVHVVKDAVVMRELSAHDDVEVIGDAEPHCVQVGFGPVANECVSCVLLQLEKIQHLLLEKLVIDNHSERDCCKGIVLNCPEDLIELLGGHASILAERKVVSRREATKAYAGVTACVQHKVIQRILVIAVHCSTSVAGYAKRTMWLMRVAACVARDPRFIKTVEYVCIPMYSILGPK